MNFVPFTKPAQNRNRIFDRRLINQHGLKATFESGIFFDVLTILVQRRRPDTVEFTTREHRFE